jgi:hypothetical protein
MLGINAIYQYLRTSRYFPQKAIAYGVALALFLSIFIPQLRFAHSRLMNAGGYTNYQNIGKWMELNTAPDAKIATVEIGAIGWYSKRYIIDILGLVNPYNAKFIGERKFDEWLKYYHPDYILGHSPLWSHEVSLKKLMEEKTYVPVDSFHFDGYILLRKAAQPNAEN